MKNIFVVPTTDATRLMRMFDHDRDELELSLQCCGWQYGVHVNITSYEEIKEGDWCIDLDTDTVFRLGNWTTGRVVKIILTTAPTLIADGVQAIDDEFLEWFVKNPSCEFVEVEIDYSMADMNSFYQIIIPQEGYICPHTKIQCDDECCVSAEDCHIVSQISVLEKPEQEAEGKYFADNADSIIVMKQETLEEVALKYKNLKLPDDLYDAFMRGANWKAECSYSEEEPDYDKIKEAFVKMRKTPMTFSPDERMYSEEEVLDILFKHTEYFAGFGERVSLTEWFEKFKKK